MPQAILSRKQAEQYSELKRNKTLYVGYNSRQVMNIFEKLVKKGYAKITTTCPYGKRYTASE